MESFRPSPSSSRLLSAECPRSRQKPAHLEETGAAQEGRFAWDADPQVGGTPAPATEAARELAPRILKLLQEAGKPRARRRNHKEKEVSPG